MPCSEFKELCVTTEHNSAHSIITAYREWADRILAEIIRKAASAIFQIGHKIGPAVLDIGDQVKDGQYYSSGSSVLWL